MKRLLLLLMVLFVGHGVADAQLVEKGRDQFGDPCSNTNCSPSPALHRMQYRSVLIQVNEEDTTNYKNDIGNIEASFPIYACVDCDDIIRGIEIWTEFNNQDLDNLNFSLNPVIDPGMGFGFQSTVTEFAWCLPTSNTGHKYVWATAIPCGIRGGTLGPQGECVFEYENPSLFVGVCGPPGSENQPTKKFALGYMYFTIKPGHLDAFVQPEDFCTVAAPSCQPDLGDGRSRTRISFCNDIGFWDTTLEDFAESAAFVFVDFWPWGSDDGSHIACPEYNDPSNPCARGEREDCGPVISPGSGGVDP